MAQKEGLYDILGRVYGKADADTVLNVLCFIIATESESCLQKSHMRSGTIPCSFLFSMNSLQGRGLTEAELDGEVADFNASLRSLRYDSVSERGANLPHPLTGLKNQV